MTFEKTIWKMAFTADTTYVYKAGRNHQVLHNQQTCLVWKFR